MDRRDFLKSTFVSVGSFLVATSIPTISSKFLKDKFGNLTFAEATELSKEAKELFYQKNYKKSASIYERIITHFPDQLNFYDGYARVLGAQQKTLETAEIYRLGLEKNSESALFMQRLSYRVKSLCMGNRKAELEFQRKHSIQCLFDYSAILLLNAIDIMPDNKGLYLHLNDLSKSLVTKNRMLKKNNLNEVGFSNSINREIEQLTLKYKELWAITRASRKPQIKYHPDSIKDRKRRKLYFEKELINKEHNIEHVEKSYYLASLRNTEKHDLRKIESIGTKTLEYFPKETNTIGFLRKKYIRTKEYSRLIALNRSVFLKNETTFSALAFINSLIRYGNYDSDLREAKELLAEYKNRILDLPLKNHTARYYLYSSKLFAKEGNLKEAREIILKGISDYKNEMNLSYILLEQYALTYKGQTDYKNGIEILKLLNGKFNTKSANFLAENPVFGYIEIYRKNSEGTILSSEEKHKRSKVLSKFINSAGQIA